MDIGPEPTSLFSKLVSDMDLHSVIGHAQLLMTPSRLSLSVGSISHRFQILYKS